jgi:hypothetical protein
VHDRGMGRNILVVGPWYKFMISQIFSKKSQKSDTIFYILIILLQIIIFGIFSPKVIKKNFWGEGVSTFMPIGYIFKSSLKYCH